MKQLVVNESERNHTIFLEDMENGHNIDVTMMK
jgi:hypothetical protein